MIEAVRWNGSNFDEVDALKPGYFSWSRETPLFPCLNIETREGTLTANVGDYIIKGVEGEVYPCGAGIFAKTYEEVAEAAREDGEVSREAVRVGNRQVIPMICRGWWFNVIVPADGVTPPHLEDVMETEESFAEHYRRHIE